MFISENIKYIEQHPLFQDNHYYVVKKDISARVRGSNVHGTIPKGSILRFTGEANADNETITMADCKYADAELCNDSYYIIQTDQLEQSLKDCTEDIETIIQDDFLLNWKIKYDIGLIALIFLGLSTLMLLFSAISLCVWLISIEDGTSNQPMLLLSGVFFVFTTIFILSAKLSRASYKNKCRKKGASNSRLEEYIKSVL